MTRFRGTLLACLGAALIALSASGWRAKGAGACAMPDDKAMAARLLLIF